MTRQLILGAVFRALGAFPSGWRYPGAHNDPLRDPAVLRRTARAAEAAKFDYLFFGEWLATGPDLEFRDPDLLARMDPLSAISYLAGVTRRIGLIATANTGYYDLFTLARQTASIDRLSGGRAGINLVTGADPRAAANHGRDPLGGAEPRYDEADEYVRALRMLWDSWEDDAFLRDRAPGRLIDPERLHRTDAVGAHVRVAGPLTAPRPVQGHLPIVHAGGSARARRLAGELADVSIVAVASIADAQSVRAETSARAAAAGRTDGGPRIVTPILPVVAGTTEEAQAVYDTLLGLVPLAGDRAAQAAGIQSVDFPGNRTIRALSGIVGVPLGTPELDAEVPLRVARRFSEGGQRLLEAVQTRTGRRIGGEHPVTYRRLLAAHAAPAGAVVGSGSEVADQLEAWFGSGAVDGFNILPPFLPAQFDAFTALVVPELQRRGIARTEYEGTTLRDHLGLPRPANLHVADAGRARAQGISA
ncbi:NtaA/DmoA family FMN-dependent monooxygenase [Leifsonia sp. PS1209]|uniref:NtaA/DmoA family FMN-dependent monooxygenase n=1 Tax=Leifsonia sp. PS1209 TaxID=2724914 RepID=UPI001442A515|nr:NtaA/DmoA family FMN-dependent monooxygenase [Leifsonia sp. PS1209]QIZ99349.1 NtaA/DmoA family FMN-dependent monooxygenase [Leifsonia sp. PS1209]